MPQAWAKVVKTKNHYFSLHKPDLKDSCPSSTFLWFPAFLFAFFPHFSLILPIVCVTYFSPDSSSTGSISRGEERAWRRASPRSGGTGTAFSNVSAAIIDYFSRSLLETTLVFVDGVMIVVIVQQGFSIISGKNSYEKLMYLCDLGKYSLREP